MSGALTRYRVMAYVVGIGLAVLVFIGIPLQLAGHDGVVRWVGMLHGYLYIVYLLTALDLFRRSRLSGGRLNIWHLLAMVCAGFVPILAFVAERWITRTVEATTPEPSPERAV
jgi:integral membrane protein